MQHNTDNPMAAMPTPQQINNAKIEFGLQQEATKRNYVVTTVTMTHSKHGAVKINAGDDEAEAHWIAQGYTRASGK